VPLVLVLATVAASYVWRVHRQLAATGGPGSAAVVAHYRTTGLRLLARSGGKVLLVHDGWSPRTGDVIVLSDDDQLGWEFSR